MNKSRSTESQIPVDSEKDWFLPAILSTGGVSQSFKAVGKSLEDKLSFIHCLNTNLSSYQGKSSDSITELRNRIEELENTLTFRLGMLSPDRPGAWFRENMNQGSGPFGSSILSEPVLAPYEINKLAKVRYALKNSFEQQIRESLNNLDSFMSSPYRFKSPKTALSLLNACYDVNDVVLYEKYLHRLLLDCENDGSFLASLLPCAFDRISPFRLTVPGIG